MANNDQWLFENTPKMMYKNAGLVKTSQLKIYSEIVVFTANKKRINRKTVTFGSFFSPGCLPLIAGGYVAPESHVNVQYTFAGIGRVIPDHRGAIIYLNAISPTSGGFLRQVYFEIIAVGY